MEANFSTGTEQLPWVTATPHPGSGSSNFHYPQSTYEITEVTQWVVQCLLSGLSDPNPLEVMTLPVSALDS